jgi:zeaxanthin glucosyltransferase
MGRIVMVPLSEKGHVTPMLGLARGLRERGHEIVFATHLDMHEAVESQGFGAIAVEADMWPVGWKEHIRNAPAAERDAYHRQVRMRRYMEQLLGEPVAEIAALEPDLVLCDVILWACALGAHRLGLGVGMVNIMFSHRLRPGRPPLTSALSPRVPEVLLAGARWKQSCLALDPALPERIHHLTARCGHDAEQVSFDSTMVPVLSAFPEFVLTPRAYDFPSPPLPGVTHYIPPFDADRVEAVAPEIERFVDPGRVLVFASLGSEAYRYAGAVAVFSSLIEALRERPDWHAVLAVGPELQRRDRLPEPPPNVLLMGYAPQIWALHRASVFVTHGGINGVLESAACSVPMLVVPQRYDQPGNAGRVQYHGLGLHLPPPAAGPEGIGRCLDRLVNEPGFRAAAVRLRSQVERERDGNDATLDAIEHAFRTAPRNPRPSPRAPEATVRGWMFLDPRYLPGGGEHLEAGTSLEDDRPGPLEVGVRGFAISPCIGEALQCARGPLLVRAALSSDIVVQGEYALGRRLDVLWSLDASPALTEFAWWCARQATRESREREPELAQAFEDARDSPELGRPRWVVDLARENSHPGDGTHESAGRWKPPVDARALVEIARENLDHGYGAYESALIWRPPMNAQLTRQAMLASLSMAEVGERAGTREGAARFDGALLRLKAEAAEELKRRVIELAIEKLGSAAPDDELSS